MDSEELKVETTVTPLSNSEIIEEETTDNDVAIAQIEADKEIAIAAIHADTEQTRIEAEKEEAEIQAETIVEVAEEANKDIEECRNQINQLAETVERLTEQVNSLIPPIVLATEIETETLETPVDASLTLPSTQAPTASIPMEISERSEEENQEAAEPSRGRKFVAI